MALTYNHMITDYLPKHVTKTRSHKKDELRKVYENIVKLSKNTGFYKINLSKENQMFAFGVKDTAISLRSKLEEMNDPLLSGFDFKYAVSEDEEILEATLLNNDISKLPENITITVDSLASAQENRSKDLFHHSHGLVQGVYDFRVNIRDEAHDLSYNQKDRLNNRDTLQRMADYLNEALPELSVTLERDAAEEYSHIKMKANFTGKFGERSFSFKDADYYRDGIVEFFGFNLLEKDAVNTQFSINGTEWQTNSNTFQIENTLQIELNDTSDKAVNIRIIRDSKVVISQLDSVLGTFNELLQLAAERKVDNTESHSAIKLINELKGIESAYAEELKICGLIVGDEGIISRDSTLSIQAAEEGRIEELFNNKNGFIARILDKADSITINPMEYLDKMIVTYPDNKQTFVINPYVTSMYSGLFFSSYC
ncbi:MAG TPA: hypothetical protein VJ888_04870 [Mobilitalea sp.]|nr:hypothetical protein [Mobilitalea sp.]